MAQSDSEDDNLEDLVFENDDDQDGEVDEDQINDGVPDDVTEEEGDDSDSDTSGSGSEDEDEDEEELDIFAEAGMDIDAPDDQPEQQRAGSASTSELIAEIEKSESPPSATQPVAPPPPEIPRKRSLSPAGLRKKAIRSPVGYEVPPGTYTVEAICALPHPVPTHALASSFCMSHLLTGSDDGYIRNYDIFPSVNGKNFLTAPQRHHSGVVEGIMKSGQLRFWWENPVMPSPKSPTDPLATNEDNALAPVYSLAMHSDALWALSGSDVGHINLFTVRQEPGRRFHAMSGHRGPVSALAIDHDEKGFFSAGWDGDAIQWDLNTGQRIRTFTSHGAQLAAIAIRPERPPGVDCVDLTNPNEPETDHGEASEMHGIKASSALNEDPVKSEPSNDKDDDTRSNASHDSLFDDDDGDEKPTVEKPADTQPPPPKPVVGQAAAPKNAPPLLEHSNYSTFSPDTLLTASIDGQVILWDRRVNSGNGVGRLWMSEKTPPWCLSACWSWDGGQIYAGRRNGTVDVWDARLLGQSGPRNIPRILKVLRNPTSSGVVSCVAAFPDCKHVACASVDNLRLWNVAEAPDADSFAKPKGGLQFKIIPGHHGGYISQLLVDPGARFLISASSNRGWHGESTKTVFVHDIKREM